MKLFYNISIILIFVTFFLSCLNLKSISDTSHQYYPYYYYGKWGFNNDSGDCVIKPQFDTVMFFSKGLAIAKINGKYGYIDINGKWHIPPKYDEVFEHYNGFVGVRVGKKWKCIDRNGKKVCINKCPRRIIGSCYQGPRRNLLKNLVKVNGKFEIIKSYLLIANIQDNGETYFDTSKIKIDTFYELDFQTLILKKENKYALYRFEIAPIKVFIKDSQDFMNLDSISKHGFERSIEFKYDGFKVLDEQKHLGVKLGNKWGILNCELKLVVPINYYSVDVIKNLALVEFEYGKKGFKEIGYFIGSKYFEGKEYYK